MGVGDGRGSSAGDKRVGGTAKGEGEPGVDRMAGSRRGERAVDQMGGCQVVSSKGSRRTEGKGCGPVRTVAMVGRSQGAGIW